MKQLAKKSLVNGLVVAKRAVNSNRHTRKLARRTKQILLQAIGDNQQRELYNLNSFYPTIQDYYDQSKDYHSKSDPLISILLPTYNTPATYLRECIDSIIIQSYPEWELCIADDKSSDKQVIKIIKEYQKKDARIKLIERPANGHISEATNSALTIARGEFVALMDHDDVLWPNALYEMMSVIRKNKNVDFIYSDEDKIDGSGKVHSYPFLKPDFSPEFLESCNYITHFSCIRRSVMEDIGGFRKGTEGAQDWDLFIRISEKTQNIVHIPKLLYSWRIHEASTASDTDAKPYVYEAQKKLLTDHLRRTKRKGNVETGIITQHRTIKYAVDENATVTLVIFYHELESCLRLVRSLLTHPAGLLFEIVYAYSDVIPEAAKTRLDELLPETSKNYLRLSKADEANKYHVVGARSQADYLIFAEDNTEITCDNWVKTLIADCQLPGVGVVGPVMLDATEANIYSAGVGIGYGPKGCIDMLQGMPFNDPHYSRGLYAKSRRNVSALNEALFAVSRGALAEAASATSALDICLALLKKDYRHIYTPYVQVLLHDGVPARQMNINVPSVEDRYLNPNFNHENQRMEVRA